MNKKMFLFVLLILMCIITVSAKENILSVFEKSYTVEDLEVCLKNGLEKLSINLNEEVPEENLRIINFILKNTYENNIHKMRGEEENQVYTKKTGEEAVFDKDGKLVTNPWNQGSYNYGKYEMPIQKFELDIWPWLVWGNARNDPTTFEERFYYYIMDLDRGIQEYIFLENKNDLEKVQYSNLGETDKLVYQFFNYLLFNKTYKLDLSEQNIIEYTKSADNYWKYLLQLLELSGYK